MSELSNRLKEKRKNAGLKVSEVVKELGARGIKLSEKTIYNWESGFRTPDADEFICLCEIYDVQSFSEFDKKEKAPKPEGSEDKERIIDEFESDLRSVLSKHGVLIGSDLSDADSNFLSHVISLIDAYFKKGV